MTNEGPTSDTPDKDDHAARMDRAVEIFLEVKPMGLAQREEVIARACGTDRELRDLVLLLLRGDAAPLRVETLAEQVRAASDAVLSESAVV
ncbi:MAG: hypothetical protein U0640_06830 [Phycisphaerales bacterium]